LRTLATLQTARSYASVLYSGHEYRDIRIVSVTARLAKNNFNRIAYWHGVTFRSSERGYGAVIMANGSAQLDIGIRVNENDGVPKRFDGLIVTGAPEWPAVVPMSLGRSCDNAMVYGWEMTRWHAPLDPTMMLGVSVGFEHELMPVLPSPTQRVALRKLGCSIFAEHDAGSRRCEYSGTYAKQPYERMAKCPKCGSTRIEEVSGVSGPVDDRLYSTADEALVAVSELMP